MKTAFCAILVAIILLTSCSQKFSLQKKRYTKGFYFAGAGRSKQITKSVSAEPIAVSKPGDEAPEVMMVKAEPKKIELTKEFHSSVPDKKQIRIINKCLEKEQHSLRQANYSVTNHPSLSRDSKQNFSKSSGKKIDGLYVGVAIGGLLGLILFFLYLLATYTLAQALIIILIFLLITALVGGGAYVGFGF